jgi:hypothetical protein
MNKIRNCKARPRKTKSYINETQLLIKNAINNLSDYSVLTGDQTHLDSVIKLGEVLKQLHNYKAHKPIPTPPKIKIKPHVFYGFNTCSK